MTKEELLNFLTVELENFQENKSKIENATSDFIDGISNIEFLFRYDMIFGFINEMIDFFEKENEN